MMKKSILSTLLATAFVPAFAAVSCPTPDTATMVTMGSLVTSVPNRVVDGACTLDDLISDEQAWGSQSAFSRSCLKNQL